MNSVNFRTVKINGVVTGGECRLHGWLQVGSSGIYENVRSSGRTKFECRACRNARTNSHNIRNRKSKRPYRPKANYFRVTKVNGKMVVSQIKEIFCDD